MTGDSSLTRAQRFLRHAADRQLVARGVLEVTRSIERREARLVWLASDLDRPELASHVRELCLQRSIPLVEGLSRAELGRSSGIPRPAAAVAVIGIADHRVFASLLAGDVPDIGHTLRGLQELARHCTDGDRRSPSWAAVKDCLERLPAAPDDPLENESALGSLLREIVLLSTALDVDLQSLADRWLLQAWLEPSETP